jgi:hypothetical protein
VNSKIWSIFTEGFNICRGLNVAKTSMYLCLVTPWCLSGSVLTLDRVERHANRCRFLQFFLVFLKINYWYIPEIQFAPKFIPDIFDIIISDCQNLEYFYRAKKVLGVIEYCQNDFLCESIQTHCKTWMYYNADDIIQLLFWN